MPESTKHARGSYASLICSNCSSRKTKCRLPSHVNLQPSDLAQPDSSACQRCSELGLDCIVRATLLGRSRRSRENAARVKSQVAVRNDQTTAISSGVEDDGNDDVHNFLLLTIPDESFPQPTKSDPGFSTKMFESLLSPQHLMAAVLSHENTFGASILCTVTYTCRALSSLISNGMATLMDERLFWHRFYVPLTPTLVSLRQTMLVETVPFSLGTATLFALLALLALDAPSNCLREDPQLRASLQSALMYYGEEYILTLPATRHTLATLLLLHNYKISALATSQRGARLAIKSGLYMALARSVAQKIDLHHVTQRIDIVMPPTDATQGRINFPADVEEWMIDALQWCNILVNDGRGAVAGFQNLLSTLRETIIQMEPMMAAMSSAVRHYFCSSQIIYHYTCLRSHMILMRHCVSTYSCWNSLEKLGELIRSDERCSHELYTEITQIMEETATSGKMSSSEKRWLGFLVEMQLEQRKVVFSGLAILFALVSSFRHRHKEERPEQSQSSPSVHPQQAISIANDLIDHFKSEQSGAILDLTLFLQEFGDDRDARFARILARFAYAFTQESSLEDVAPWTPPQRVAVELLFYAKLLVENSAARMQGWAELHPMLEEHLQVFTACANRLESMATGNSRSFNEAFADGCLFAASAKLIRSLHKILVGWKTRLAKVAEQKKRSEADQNIENERAAERQNVEELQDSLHDVDFDELFTQWSDWPQVDFADFADFASHLPGDDNVLMQ